MLRELADLGWGFKRIAAEYSRRTGISAGFGQTKEIVIVKDYGPEGKA